MIICLHSRPRNGVISLQIVVGRIDTSVHHGLVWSTRGTGEARVDCVKSVDAPDIGEDAHRAGICSVLMVLRNGKEERKNDVLYLQSRRSGTIQMSVVK